MYEVYERCVQASALPKYTARRVLEYFGCLLDHVPAATRLKICNSVPKINHHSTRQLDNSRHARKSSRNPRCALPNPEEPPPYAMKKGQSRHTRQRQSGLSTSLTSMGQHMKEAMPPAVSPTPALCKIFISDGFTNLETAWSWHADSEGGKSAQGIQSEGGRERWREGRRKRQRSTENGDAIVTKRVLTVGCKDVTAPTQRLTTDNIAIWYDTKPVCHRNFQCFRPPQV